MNKRYIVGRIEYLREKIDTLETAAHRIQDHMIGPANARIGEYKKPFDYRRREITLAESIDIINEIRAVIDKLQSELDDLLGELSTELEEIPLMSKHFAAKRIVINRLIKNYTWKDVSELTGYNERSCRRLFDQWLNSAL